MRVKVGGSHSKLQRQVAAFQRAGIKLTILGCPSISSKYQIADMNESDEAIKLLRSVGGTIPGMNPRLLAIRDIPKSIGPNDVLDNGTTVRIGGRGNGVVIGHEIVPAHPCGMIAVHTIKLDSGEEWRGNYSFVYLVKG